MRRLVLSLLLGIVSFSLSAQSGTISINVFVPEDDIPAEASRMLVTKLNQIVMNYGLADNGLTDRFFLSPEVVVSTKDIVPSNPPKVSQKLDVILMIGDVVDNKLYGSLSLPVVGVGQNETKAFINAFQKIPVKSKLLETFILETKEKIVEYYRINGKSIISEAELLASNGQYDDALGQLFSIPDVCEEVCEASRNAALKVYKMKIDSEGEAFYAKAKAIWDAGKSEAAAREALDLIQKINPESAVSSKGESFIKQMTTYLNSQRAKRERVIEENKQKEEERKDREWDFKVRQYEDALELERQKVKDQATVERVRVESEKVASTRIGKIDIKKVTRIVKSWVKSN